MGPGLLESIYVWCLVYELQTRGIKTLTEVPIPVIFKGVVLSKYFRIDVLVEDEIIMEIKSVEILLPVHIAQIISHLKLTDKRLGFLVNFNVPVLKDGFKRFVNNF
jgi:GxxExxY protein